MKAEKRRRLIQEAVDRGRALSIHPETYRTIDLVTGLPEFPAIIAIPFEPHEWARSGHIKIDLPAMGYRLVKIERPEPQANPDILSRT